MRAAANGKHDWWVASGHHKNAERGCPDSPQRLSIVLILWLFQETLPLPYLEAKREPEFLSFLDTVQSTEQCWETDPLEATEALRPICSGRSLREDFGLQTVDLGALK